jgi:NAD(P)-dependent dehydrogenase (short-subunit alcohol dehydrogenase family)
VDTLLVFGARNLGRVLAREYSARGWRVAAVARSESTLEQLRDEVPDAVGMIGDAGSAEDVERIFEDVGDVDLVVNAITTTPSSGGPIHEAPPEALDAYTGTLLPAIFNVLRIGGRVLAAKKSGGNPGRGPWAAAAFATRALVQSQAGELRDQGVHVALLIVDAIIESEKTKHWLEDEPPERSAAMEDVVRAIEFLQEQSPRAWTHELQLTPALERWVP